METASVDIITDGGTRQKDVRFGKFEANLRGIANVKNRATGELSVLLRLNLRGCQFDGESGEKLFDRIFRLVDV